MDNEKQDPLGPELYTPLVKAERLAGTLFYLSAILSLAALFVAPPQYPLLGNIVAVAFPVSVIGLFVLSLVIRLYFFPRAQRGRLRDFLSHAFGKQLQHKTSIAYYNNAATTSSAKIMAQTLESVFFTKSILLKMASKERLLNVAYLLAWLIAVLNRTTDLAIIGVAAQILFSEQILSRWLRLEWLRTQCETVYDQLFRLIQAKSLTGPTPVDYFTWYEILKATAAVSLSTRVFDRERQVLNGEWEQIRKILDI